MGKLFAICAVTAVIIGIIMLIWSTTTVYTDEELARRVDDTGPITSTLVPRLDEVYSGERYSWGGQPQSWHKECIAPILVVAAVVTVMLTLAKSRR